ncbi:MAG: tRNA pseudouridine(38-40) synthase TruA [Rickettsiales bacterium]|nr:tRNA pseudouridine(38-40) synthase TruA [Rickettsiales bacterium]|tara:strand:+ start:3511 stop:4251 length:741 start_codon:yes stop_codon:yes gene_type:complete
MARYKLTIEYDGTGYSGWQKQENVPTIQQTLQDAFKNFLGYEPDITGSGRTDAGVHACGQVAHLDIEESQWTADSLMAAGNHYLKNTGIALLNIEVARDEFHARFDAVKRFYTYKIINRRAPLTWQKTQAWQVYQALDVEMMQQAANILIGHHDFSSFRDSQCQSLSPLKTLDAISIEHQQDTILIHVDARSFLHHQVRIIVGTLVEVGRGKISVEHMTKILEAKDRCAAGPTAPAHGLYFDRVCY